MLNEKMNLFKIRSQSDRAYLASLYEQFKNPRKDVKKKIGTDFFPSAMLNRQERRKLLGVVDYRDLIRHKKKLEAFAGKVSLILNPMNGGIGTSLKREDYLKSIWKSAKKKGKPFLGAKGSDLYANLTLNRRRIWASISEIKMLRLLKDSRKYSRTCLQMLASTDTIRSIKNLFDTPNLYARAGLKFPWGTKTYREIFEENRRVLLADPLVQSSLPNVDSKGHLTYQRTAPGGHGQWGVYLLIHSMNQKYRPGKQVLIGAIYNEDGINNTVDPIVTGWMAQEKIPLIMLSTSKTTADKKGGQIGLFKLKGGKIRKGLLEEAQAISCGQAELFREMGLTQGNRGQQYFNTNTALLNYSVLSPFLADLVRVIGQKKFESILGPDLIQNRKQEMRKGFSKEVIQLEGALGSCLMNLDSFLSTTDDPQIIRLFKRHGLLEDSGNLRFLKIVNIDLKNRMKFFTPVKNAFDFWLQFYSDLFKVNLRHWNLETNKPGFVPSVNLSDYYEDVSHVFGAFGGAAQPHGPVSVKNLESLQIKGKVQLTGAVLKGNIKILSQSDKVVDLNQIWWKQRRDKKIVLKNCSIIIDSSGSFKLYRNDTKNEP